MAKMQSNSNQLTSGAWAGDYLNREHLLPGGAKVDASQFLTTDGTTAVVGVAGAASGATTVPVAALTNAIPSGTVLDFGGAKFARLTANAALGATSLTVTALVTALVSGDTATYAGTGTKPKTIVNGTLVGRTWVERAANTPFGPAADTDDEVMPVAFDISDATQNNDVDLYRYGGVVKENLLPQWATLSATLKGKIRANYQTTTGVS